MKLKSIVYFWVVFCIFLPFGNVIGQHDSKKIKTVEEVYQAYPERMNLLLQSINLDHNGLTHVRAAFDKGNIVMACQQLLNYYKESATAKFLRKELPATSDNLNHGTDSILRNIFTFYSQSAKVPNNANGRLDWTHQGPANDIEWAWALNRHYHLRTLLESYFGFGE